MPVGRFLWQPADLHDTDRQVLAAYCLQCREFIQPALRDGAEIRVRNEHTYLHWKLSPTCAGAEIAVPVPQGN